MDCVTPCMTMASPVSPHQGLSPCLSARRGAALALILELGGLSLGQAVVISEKRKTKSKKKGAMCLKEKHLACETLLALRPRGL